ncbi:MAG TPA: lysophospholipid acyltransferase family protein [Candidatus Aminicenantes bacterium]|nr:lysophospholipid acyltransferase family protein [Candidatus Aminicenantes bacterium]
MRKILVRLRSLLIWSAALPVFAAACAAIWLGSFVLRGRGLERLIKGGCRAVLLACGVRVRAAGRERLVPGRQYVAMMNHVNFFDPLVFQIAFPAPLRGVEEESHFRWPVYGGVIRRIGMFPISRKDTARAVETLRRAAAWLRERPEFSFAVMPEGTRTLDGRLGPFKRGGFLMAVEAGLDILPVVQRGARAVARKGSLNIRPGEVALTIGPAVPTAGCTKETIGELIEAVRRVFLDVLGE